MTAAGEIAWFDPGVYRNVKVLKAGTAAAGFWMLAIAWARDNRTGGTIPIQAVKQIAPDLRGWRRVLARLVDARVREDGHGLLEPIAFDAKGNAIEWRIHDFDAFDRAALAERGAVPGLTPPAARAEGAKGPVDPVLSARRAEIGRRGAEAKWAGRRSELLSVEEPVVGAEIASTPRSTEHESTTSFAIDPDGKPMANRDGKPMANGAGLPVFASPVASGFAIPLARVGISSSPSLSSEKEEEKTGARTRVGEHGTENRSQSTAQPVDGKPMANADGKIVHTSPRTPAAPDASEPVLAERCTLPAGTPLVERCRAEVQRLRVFRRDARVALLAADVTAGIVPDHVELVARTVRDVVEDVGVRIEEEPHRWPNAVSVFAYVRRALTDQIGKAIAAVSDPSPRASDPASGRRLRTAPQSDEDRMIDKALEFEKEFFAEQRREERARAAARPSVAATRPPPEVPTARAVGGEGSS
jgi:hypothetical protein